MIVALIHWRIKPDDNSKNAFLKHWKTENPITGRTGLIAEFLSDSLKIADFPSNSAMAAIRTPEHSAHRCTVAEESEELGQEVRLLLYGKRSRRYKVYYSVKQTTPSRGAGLRPEPRGCGPEISFAVDSAPKRLHRPRNSSSLSPK
jgi:hypothetical protein